MKKVFFCLLFLAVEAFADDAALDRVRKNLEEASVLRTNFEQTKTMRALKKPLILSGRLVFSKSHGILWVIDSPFQRRYVLGEASVAEIAEDGTRRERASADLPGFSRAARIFRAILNGDARTLEDSFEVCVKTPAPAEGASPGSWEVTLIPKEDSLVRFLSEMRISGSRFVENLTIEEALGDRSEIRFTGTRGDASLSEDERALFEDLSLEKP
jgi:hypothetical protein